MKKLYKWLLLCSIIIYIIRCIESSKPHDMSDMTYEIGLKILKTTDNYLDGKIDKKEAIRELILQEKTLAALVNTRIF